MKNLKLSGNNISEILPGTFEGQEKLTYLDLGDNSLSTVNGEMWIGLKSLTTLRISGNNLKFAPSESFSNLPKLETNIIDFNILITLKTTILSPSTYPDSKSIPKIALEENFLKCDKSSCWLKKLEAKGMFAHYMKDGRVSRPRCYNMSKFWDEVDLNCTGKLINKAINEGFKAKRSTFFSSICVTTSFQLQLLQHVTFSPRHMIFLPPHMTHLL